MLLCSYADAVLLMWDVHTTTKMSLPRNVAAVFLSSNLKAKHLLLGRKMVRVFTATDPIYVATIWL